MPLLGACDLEVEIKKLSSSCFCYVYLSLCLSRFLTFFLLLILSCPFFFFSNPVLCERERDKEGGRGDKDMSKGSQMPKRQKLRYKGKAAKEEGEGRG